jgi:hypothetical protein
LSNLNKFTDEKKNNLNYLDNNLIVNKNVIKNKTNFFFKNKNFSNCNTTLLSKLFIKKNIFNKKVDLKEKIKLTNIILLKKSFLIKEAFVKKRLNSTINNKKPILLSKIFIKKKVFDNTKLTKTNHLMTKKKHILRLLKLSILREKEFLFNSIFLKKISSEKEGLFLNKTYVKENFLKLLKKSFSKNEDIMKKKLNNFVKDAIKYIDKKKKPVNIKPRNLNKNLNENFLKENFFKKKNIIKKKLNSTIPSTEKQINIKKKVFDNTKLTKTNHLMTKKKHSLRLLKLSILREKEFLFNSIFLKKISSEKEGLFLNKTYVKENFLKLLKKSFSKNEDIMKKKLNNFVNDAIKYIDKKPVNIKLRNLNKNLNENFLKENFFKKKNIIKKKLNSTIPSTEKQINIKKKNQSLKKFTLTKSLKEKFLQKSFYRKNTTLKKKPLVFHKNFFLKYANKNKNLFFKKKKFLNNFSKKNFNFNFLKKKKQIFKNFSYEINFFKLYNTQFNFKKFTNSEEPTRLLKNSMGGDLNVTLVKKNYKNDKNFNNKNYLFKLRFDKDISYKNTPKASYFTFKQKRYKRRTLIQPFVKNYKNDLKKDLKLKSNFNLNKNYIMEDNIKNPTKYYRMLKKNKTRSENMPITISKRLLRVKRTLVIPTHINITAITNSYDVVHSWFIPGLGLKMDCVPGRSTHHTFYVDNAGFYYGQCAEICGRYHHHMPIRVCALPFEHFLI